MNIYRRLNPKLLVQVGLSLNLFHWANISNISLTIKSVNILATVVSSRKHVILTTLYSLVGA